MHSVVPSRGTRATGVASNFRGLLPRGGVATSWLMHAIRGRMPQGGDAIGWLIQSGDVCHKLAMPQVGEHSHGAMY